METNNIITAPQIDGVDRYYQKWKETNFGSMKSFYEFMTTPSAEREKFMSSLGEEVALSFRGRVAEVTLREYQ